METLAQRIGEAEGFRVMSPGGQTKPCMFFNYGSLLDRPVKKKLPEPQVFVKPEGIHIVIRNAQRAVTRIYFFKRTPDAEDPHAVFFDKYAPQVPFLFEACWCFDTYRTFTSLSACLFFDAERLRSICSTSF